MVAQVLENTMIPICQATGARVYINLSPRKLDNAVGHMLCILGDHLVTNSFNASTLDNLFFKTMNKSVPPVKRKRYWLIDVDDMTDAPRIKSILEQETVIFAEVPSKTGIHYICRGFQVKPSHNLLNDDIKKQANTNLYIP